MKVGRYAAGKYIGSLARDDPEKKALDEKLRQQTIKQNTYDASTEVLLSKRNAQLAKFITHIATLVHYTEHDDVTM